MTVDWLAANMQVASKLRKGRQPLLKRPSAPVVFRFANGLGGEAGQELSTQQIVRKHQPQMQSSELLSVVLAALDDGKARDVRVIDVRSKTSITDYMVIASGTSERHVKSLADQVVEKAKSCDVPPLGVEGQATGEWVLVDLGDAIVHVMKPQVREFYQLEKFWQGDYRTSDGIAAAG